MELPWCDLIVLVGARGEGAIVLLVIGRLECCEVIVYEVHGIVLFIVADVGGSRGHFFMLIDRLLFCEVTVHEVHDFVFLISFGRC